MAFAAKYSGACDDCGQEIIPGQQVTYVGEGNLVHVKCKKVEICTTCFLTKPCDCD